MTKITVETNGFKGEFGIAEIGVGFDDQNFGTETEFDVEPSKEYYFAIRGGVEGSYITFETKADGTINENSITPSAAATVDANGLELKLETRDLVIRRGGYRGNLSTNLKERGDVIEFKSSNSQPLKAIKEMLFTFDTTATIGCSTFRGILKADGIVEMNFAQDAVTTGSSEITLNTVETTLTPVYGEKLLVSGQPDMFTSTTRCCLIRSVCVRIHMLGANNNQLGAIDLTPTEK